ncbi:endonuclease III [Candidatus Gracilibacteria bacterium]|nr:endonuclease III [Candidatus Gracilibacteria bacterium]OIO75687.1 MAG: endonuclease III [Candidatus Gracilibacteria bacterium CG1_02_38_174]PIQ12228.1 MAG: endonuclease III [Candidatus Gracilibacteria bacterium CG18_big_fil_WC_8_21_14_2_50_38_16]PIQ40969.1 MAG: endonuclease III [Candidatus Gracilibacteria bacterium CG12_big_fil_rev_8_21_14_0_65_38_15]PIZ01998.1 MAG: endonuclease III [Candidatus Gracilibacteria bacterium CG_4_10_14_0_8_um_filter_38_28]
MKTKIQISHILTEIARMYPDIRTELQYETPFQFLIAVILSAQTTDKQVNKITPAIFARVREPEDMAKISPKELEKMVSSVNFYRNKAKFIWQSGEKLVREFGGIIPNDLGKIQTLPGVGVKTAKVVLGVLYDAPYVGVDTHVHRVMNRIGIVRTKSPEETDKILEKKFTYEQKMIIHHPLVLFGRYQCTARNPKCSTCPIREMCDYGRRGLISEGKSI